MHKVIFEIRKRMDNEEYCLLFNIRNVIPDLQNLHSKRRTYTE